MSLSIESSVTECRDITANIGKPGPGYTTLESIPGAENAVPLTVAYYQDKHFQSLGYEDEILLSEDTVATDDVTLEDIPYNFHRVVQDFSNCRTDEWGNLLESDDESVYSKSDTDEEEIDCNFCNKTFSQASKLKRHVENIHKNSKKLKVTVEHTVILSKVRNVGSKFICPFCKKACRDNYNLKRHERSHN